MSTTLLDLKNQIKIDYKLSGDPNFSGNRLNLMINQAQRYVQIQLNGLGIKKWEDYSKLLTSIIITTGTLTKGQIYLVDTEDSADFSNCAEVISGTAWTSGCIFKATSSSVPTSWGAGSEEIYAIGMGPGTTFLSSTNNVSAVPIAYLPHIAESPKSIRFVQTFDSTTWNQAKEVNELFVHEHLSNTYQLPTGKDSIFWRSDNIIYLAPQDYARSEELTEAIIHYYRIVTDLSADTDVTEIPSQFVEHLIKRVGIEILSIKGLIKDKEKAIDGVSAAINNAYEKFLGTTQSKKADKKQKMS